LTLHQAVRPSLAAKHPNLRAERDMARQGWVESFERLADLLVDAE
jgi:hypothetical protein